MKRCPQCGREYDVSMTLCLDDGAELLYGPATTNEPATAVFSGSEAPTRMQLETESPQSAISKKTILVAIAIAVALLFGGFVAYRYISSQKQISSVAVMPFVNQSGNAELEYLSDGMTESLISSLSQIPNLNVKARSSV